MRYLYTWHVYSVSGQQMPGRAQVEGAEPLPFRQTWRALNRDWHGQAELALRGWRRGQQEGDHG